MASGLRPLSTSWYSPSRTVLVTVSGERAAARLAREARHVGRERVGLGAQPAVQPRLALQALRQLAHAAVAAQAEARAGRWGTT